MPPALTWPWPEPWAHCISKHPCLKSKQTSQNCQASRLNTNGNSLNLPCPLVGPGAIECEGLGETTDLEGIGDEALRLAVDDTFRVTVVF